MFACFPLGVISMFSIGSRDTCCEPSPMCCPPGDISGTTGLSGRFGSDETMPNRFCNILGSTGVEGVGSTGVYSSQGVGGFAPCLFSLAVYSSTCASILCLSSSCFLLFSFSLWWKTVYGLNGWLREVVSSRTCLSPCSSSPQVYFPVPSASHRASSGVGPFAFQVLTWDGSGRFVSSISPRILLYSRTMSCSGGCIGSFSGIYTVVFVRGGVLASSVTSSTDG